MFVGYALAFVVGSLLPIWPPFRGALLACALFCAFLAGTVRILNLTRPLWENDEPYCESCGGPCRDP